MDSSATSFISSCVVCVSKGLFFGKNEKHLVNDLFTSGCLYLIKSKSSACGEFSSSWNE